MSAFRVRPVALALTLGLGAVLPGLAHAQDRPDTASHACTGTWAPPTAIRSTAGFPVYVERGVVTSFGERVLLLGSPTFFWLGSDHMWPESLRADTLTFIRAINRAGALLDAGGMATPVPPVDSMDQSSIRQRPVLLRNDGERVTIAFEVAEVPPDRSEPWATRVEVATFDGVSWTAPEVALRGDRVRVEPLPAAQHVDGDEPPPFLAVLREGPRATLALAHRRGGRWSVAHWAGARYLPHARVVPASDGSATVIFMGALRTSRTVGVHALRAGLAGDTVEWSEPQLIAAVEKRFADLSAARLGGDSLLVTWSQTSSDGARDELRTVVSGDAGRSWTPTPAVETLTGMDGATLVVDAAGRAHLILRASSLVGVLGAPGSIAHATWREGKWTNPAAISTSDSRTGPGAGTAPSGRLVATWTEAIEVPGERGSMPRSLVSFWTPGCGSAAR